MRRSETVAEEMSFRYAPSSGKILLSVVFGTGFGVVAFLLAAGIIPFEEGYHRLKGVPEPLARALFGAGAAMFLWAALASLALALSPRRRDESVVVIGEDRLSVNSPYGFGKKTVRFEDITSAKIVKSGRWYKTEFLRIRSRGKLLPLYINSEFLDGWPFFNQLVHTLNKRMERLESADCAAVRIE